ncbi:MAG: PAS domain S-box protein [Balneolaceae bacterium]|nr:PAS domain S-box protein [Balneolaceae bacterium]
MGNEQQQILEQLKANAKDAEAFKQLEQLFGDLYKKYVQANEHVDLLESAIRNDYDSILITELGLEKPGPKIVYVNDGFTRMTGYSKEEAIGNTPRMLQGEKTDRAILDRLKRRLIEGQAFFGHTINYRKDGSEFINQWDIHPLINAEGEVTHWVSYQRDVTEKKETAKAIFNTDFDELLKRREEFTIKFEKTTDQSEYNCKLVTEAFEEITGLHKDVIFDKGLASVIHSDDYSNILEALNKAFNGEQSAQLCRYRTSAGGYIDMLQSFKPVKDEVTGDIKSVKSVVKLELKES